MQRRGVEPGLLVGVTGDTHQPLTDLAERRLVLLVPDALNSPVILGEGAAFERARGRLPMTVSRISTGSETIAASALRGHAVPSPRDTDIGRPTEGLREATFEVRGGHRLDFVARFRYADEAAAKRAAVIARLMLAAVAARGDRWSRLAAGLVKIDFDVSGDVVTARLTIDDELREVLSHYAERMDR